MREAETCTDAYVTIDGVDYPRTRLDIVDAVQGRCGDCGVTVGALHHPGCDMECCPKCGRQQISCGCPVEKD